jgi:UDPglucose--hexose-1-phosphate uridylyltransferase
MSVFRQDVATGGWVIIAPNRSTRPHEPNRPTAAIATAEGCPLCRGHEAETPPELLRLPGCGSPWRIRVVPNRYAVVSPAAEIRERLEGPLLLEREGVGHHELIIDSPEHDARTADLSVQQLTLLLDAYHARYESLRLDPRVAYIIVFKNSGQRAGASLTHPHSQLVTMPMAPLHLELRYERARGHYQESGRCLYCDLVDAELRADRRLVFQTERFVVFCPFASGVAYETWIVPKQHQPSFGRTVPAERAEAARVLRSTMRAIDRVLAKPDFNYVLHTAPVAGEDEAYYLWHLQILPRVATFAGFELGSGIPINTVPPEEAAARLRAATTLRGSSSAVLS